MRSIRLSLAFALTLAANAQTLTTASLTGRYFVRHVEFTTDATNNVTDARSIVGAITFSGTGSYGFIGQQVIGTGAATALTVSGTYSMSPAGVLTISNPQKPAANINARYAAEAVIGSGTEAADNTFDLFVAIPSLATQTNAALTGTFYAADFELPAAVTSQVRDSLVTMTMDGAGNITSAVANGHAANVNTGAIASQTGTGGVYSVSAGNMTLPAVGLLSATPRTLAVSNSGNVFLAGTPGGHDILIGVKGFSGAGTNASLTFPSFWLGGLRVDSTGSSEGFAGSGETINSTYITSTERLHETDLATPLDLTESNSYTIAADGSGSWGPAKIGLGASGNLLVSANVNAELDPTGYQIGFAAASPALSGSSVFINPRGVVNAASNAPGVDAVSPGEFIAIYGSGLAATTTSALAPYPALVGGVSVQIGGLPAAIYFVSAGQIDCLVPYAVTGSSVTVTVTNNGVNSNTVTVPLAKTSPGIFSLDTSGTGDGATLDFTQGNIVVSAASPAVKGDTVVVYMTGLGALTTPIADGHGATAADSAVTPVEVFVNGVQASVSYAGVSSLPGLYQINFRVPTTLTKSGELPLAILTPDAFHDQVNIAVQ